MKKNVAIEVMFRMIKALMITAVVTFLFILVLALVMYRIDPEEKVLHLGIIFTYITAGFLGGLYMGHKMDRRKFLWGIGTGLCYFCLLAVLAICIQPQVGIDKYAAVTTLLCCLLSGCVGGMLG